MPPRIGFVEQRHNAEATTVIFEYCNGERDVIEVDNMKLTNARCKVHPTSTLLAKASDYLNTPTPIYVSGAGLVGEFVVRGQQARTAEAEAPAQAQAPDHPETTTSNAEFDYIGTVTLSGEETTRQLNLRASEPWIDLIKSPDGKLEFLVRNAEEFEKALTLSAQ